MAADYPVWPPCTGAFRHGSHLRLVTSTSHWGWGTVFQALFQHFKSSKVDFGRRDANTQNSRRIQDAGNLQSRTQTLGCLSRTADRIENQMPHFPDRMWNWFIEKSPGYVWISWATLKKSEKSNAVVGPTIPCDHEFVSPQISWSAVAKCTWRTRKQKYCCPKLPFSWSIVGVRVGEDGGICSAEAGGHVARAGRDGTEGNLYQARNQVNVVVSDKASLCTLISSPTRTCSICWHG